MNKIFGPTKCEPQGLFFCYEQNVSLWDRPWIIYHRWILGITKLLPSLTEWISQHFNYRPKSQTHVRHQKHPSSGIDLVRWFFSLCYLWLTFASPEVKAERIQISVLKQTWHLRNRRSTWETLYQPYCCSKQQQQKLHQNVIIYNAIWSQPRLYLLGYNWFSLNWISVR